MPAVQPRVAFALACVVLLLASCATKQHSRDLLQITLYDYAGAVRWGDFPGAATFLDPKVLEATPLRAVDMQRYEQVQVTGYYVKNSERVGPEDVAQIVEIKLINRHTQAERSIIDRQRWRYDPELRRWWLTTGLPDITETR